MGAKPGSAVCRFQSLCEPLQATTCIISHLLRNLGNLPRQLACLFVECAALGVARLCSAALITTPRCMAKLLHLRGYRSKLWLRLTVKSSRPCILFVGFTLITGFSCTLSRTLSLSALHV